MRVLFYIRANHKEVRGGDLVQLHSTAEALRKKGVTVDLSADDNLNLAPYEIVHIFNSPRFNESLKFLDNALNQNKPVACSTIFWPKDELGVGIASSAKVQLVRIVLGEKITLILWRLIKYSSGKAKSNSTYQLERRLFARSSLLLPNSEGEQIALEKTYKISNKPYYVVRNAINGEAFIKVPSPNRDNYVLSVGRIENRKNTLKLIEACKKIGVDLVLIGGYDKQDLYALECLRRVAAYKFRHIEYIEQSKLLPYYYKAKVHAMTSWYETPGLSSMEAACAGCAIVSTDRGSTKEYFKNMVEYCDPFSQESIEKALKNALSKPFSLELRNLIFKKYTWNLAAEDTMSGYRKLLK